MADDKELQEITEETSPADADLIYLAKSLGGNRYGARRCQVGNLPHLSDAEIKSGYEANSDTNAYTDSEKSLVASAMQTGIVQVVSSYDGELVTGSTQMVYDDSIPQKTEGTQFLSVAVTPESSSNLLVIEVNACFTSDPAGWIIGGIFQDDTADALRAFTTYCVVKDLSVWMAGKHEMTSGTTSETTFKLRAGPGAAGTVYMNGGELGVGGSRIMGGVMDSFIRVTEIKL